jgi:enoyl-[acyl-carrier-protein] reductase (NADH)
VAQSIKGMINPTDIAALAVFLASDAAKSISGQVLPIDNDRQRRDAPATCLVRHCRA